MSRLKRASEEQVPAMIVASASLTQPFAPVPTRRLPATCSLSRGLVVPMPTLPAVSKVMRTVLLGASRTRSLPAPSPLVLPVDMRFHCLPPVSVLMRLSHEPPVFELEISTTCCADVTICSGRVGVVVPMPTLTLAEAPLTPAMLPNTRELLEPTNASNPIAVALVSAALPVALYPKYELPLPDTLPDPATRPKNEFWFPVWLAPPASPPKNAFELPIVF